MKSYTLQELSEIMQNKYYLTKERFVNYFISLYETTEKEAKELYDIYDKLPFTVYQGETL
jgi:hypothetical protein